MTPKSAMQEVLEQVESTTGYPVTVQPDPNLGVLATVKTANQSVPFTLIRVRPDSQAGLDPAFLRPLPASRPGVLAILRTTAIAHHVGRGKRRHQLPQLFTLWLERVKADALNRRIAQK